MCLVATSNSVDFLVLWGCSKSDFQDEQFVHMCVSSYSEIEIVSVYADPGLDFATVRARPLAQMARTRHVILVFPEGENQVSTLKSDN